MTKLLMISGDRVLATGKAGAFSLTIQELSKHFERIDVLCPRVHADRVVHSLYGNVFLHPSPAGILLQPFFILTEGLRLIAKEQHDIMTVHEYPPFLNGWGARMLRKETGIPTILELHHLVGFPRAASLTEWIGRLMTRLLLASHTCSVDGVRVVNAGVKSTLLSWGVSPDRISIVPSVYLDHSVLDTAKNQDKIYDLVFAARLVNNKGLLPVIDALAQAPHVTLLVVGDGPLRRTAEDRAGSIGVRDRVTFTGWLSSAVEVMKAVASGRIFVMNSRSEGNPRVAVEAMALGLPILATKVGIMLGLVREGHNGYFVDGSAEDLAEKATKLLADPSAVTRLGHAAMAVREHFEKTTAIKAYADFLKSFARS